NSSCGELLGLPPEFIAQPPRFDQLVEFQARGRDLRPSGVSAAASVAAGAASDAATKFTVCERSMPNGTVVEVRSGHLPDGSFVQTFTDVTKRREAEARVARLASEDPLTGLPNRRLFCSTLDPMFAPCGSAPAGSQPEAELAVF